MLRYAQHDPLCLFSSPRSLRLCGEFVFALSLSLLLLTSGCKSTTASALPKALSGNDPNSQMDFWHTLPERKAVSNDEAFHALLLFADGQDPADAYPDRVRLLKDRKMLPPGFNDAAEVPAHRGTVAVALVRTLSIKGGLTQMLVGIQPRYAVRELEYLNLYPPSSPQQTFSGAELMGIIGRAEDYQRRQAPVGSNPGADGDIQGLSNNPPAPTAPVPVPASKK